MNKSLVAAAFVATLGASAPGSPRSWEHVKVRLAPSVRRLNVRVGAVLAPLMEDEKKPVKFPCGIRC
ncbi:hypothetical protein EPO15_10620 [bacterium]|nr:MAG: hypothetical protein EPO15_10620 [bacterium]